MKQITVILCVLALLPAGYTLGQAIFTEFSGTEAPGGFPNFDTTTINCPGGQPTGLFPFGPPCTPGSRVHIRGAKFPYIVQTTDSRFTGVEEVVMNGNFEGWRDNCWDPGSGQMWGTMRLVNPEGGVWEETWTGTRTVGEGCNVQSMIRAVAHGSGIGVEGLKAEYDAILDPSTGLGVVNGRILAPGGK